MAKGAGTFPLWLCRLCHMRWDRLNAAQMQKYIDDETPQVTVLQHPGYMTQPVGLITAAASSRIANPVGRAQAATSRSSMTSRQTSPKRQAPTEIANIQAPALMEEEETPCFTAQEWSLVQR